ncbi:MAG TPA: Tat pathway signal sequence domain protein [Geminicoccaceae bacterium]|nr:Tat pathway signal sequence domain protein [Geminicoccus sp.]HMU50802.1 Tat pathway signal sequence domain protein [Geminicoccaceae bacterium]
MQMRPARRAAGALALLLVANAASAAAEGPALRIELNRLEPLDKACRVYLVLANGTAESFESFKLDLVLFDTDGVIARRLAVETAPLRPEKTSVKLFDLDDLACDRVGTVLVNDVLACSTAAGPIGDCVTRVETASRASAQLVK